MKWILILLGSLNMLYAQTSNVGLVDYSSYANSNTFLFSPKNDTEIFLINSCGEKLNSWTSDYEPGNTEYFLPNGNIITERLLNTNPTMGAGGEGGIFEMYNWEGDLLWQYEVSDSFELAHHDFSILPNGNILVLAWDYRTEAEAIQAGRDTAFLNFSVWSEKIVEIKPILPDSAEIVWEWFLWDHLIQDHDSTKNNFGVVSENPSKLDINVQNISNPDWIHANSLSYNPANEQIILGCRNLSEFLVIDHSTTTAEAAGSTGGRWGKGGDFLFRLGYTSNYKVGDESDRLFYQQHNANWVNYNGYSSEIMVFNNGRGRGSVGELFTNVLKVVPKLNADSSYVLNQTFEVDTIIEIYKANPPQDFYAGFLSGASQISDTSYIVSHGPNGEFFIVDENQEIQWKYIIPINSNGNAIDYTTNPEDLQDGNRRENFFFKANVYREDFVGFADKDLTSQGFVELNRPSGFCDVVSTVGNNHLEENSRLYPNPTKLDQDIILQFDSYINELSVDLYNLNGEQLKMATINNISNNRYSVNLSDNNAAAGLYIIRLSYLTKTGWKQEAKKLLIE